MDRPPRLLIAAICLLGLFNPYFRTQADDSARNIAVDGNRQTQDHTDRGLVARVPFELAGNHVYLPAHINGRGPYSFVLDTGSSTSAIRQSLADELRIKRWPFAWKGAGYGGWARIKLLWRVRLEFGGIQRRPFTMSLPLFHGQRPIEGILGADWFRRYVIALDFPARELRLYEPHDYRPDRGAAEIPLRFWRRLPFITAAVGGVEGAFISGQYNIDSGHSGCLEVSAAFAKSNRLLAAGNAFKLDLGSDVAGSANERMVGQVPYVRLGPYTVPQPETYIDLHPTLLARKQVGVIGTGLLRRFDVVFDYPHRRLFLKPNSDFARSFDRRWTGTIVRISTNDIRLKISGAEVVATPPKYDRFHILKIKPGSPADQAGLRFGDKILALDNTPLSALSLEHWFELSGQSGRECQFKIQRGNQIFSCPLTADWECYWDKRAAAVAPKGQK